MANHRLHVAILRNKQETFTGGRQLSRVRRDKFSPVKVSIGSDAPAEALLQHTLLIQDDPQREWTGWSNWFASHSYFPSRYIRKRYGQ